MSNADQALQLINQAVIDLGSKAAVATKMGVSRTAISLVLAGKYKGDPANVYATAIAVFGGVDCPHLEQRIDVAACIAYGTGLPPTQNPMAMRHYRACQSCPNHCSKGRSPA